MKEEKGTDFLSFLCLGIDGEKEADWGTEDMK